MASQKIFMGKKKLKKTSPMLNANAVLTLIFSLSSVQADTKINAKDIIMYCTLLVLFLLCIFVLWAEEGSVTLQQFSY